MIYDNVIIGAGIAGLSAATAIIESSNLSVALIECKEIGSNNPSPLTFLEVIKEYDLLDCIKNKYSSFTFHNLNRSSIKYILPDEPLAVLDYKKACRKLFGKLNQEENNFHFINQTVVAIEPRLNSVLIRFDDGKTIRAKLLIDASGKSQFVASQLKVEQESASYYSLVYGAFYTDIQNLDQNLCCFLMPHRELGSGGGWFYSIGKNSASFGYAHITDTPDMDSHPLSAIFQKAQNEFQPYATYLRNAKIKHIEKGVIPISYLSKFLYDRILIVGDAAGMATNWTCMGVEPALKYGKLAGTLSIKAITQNDIAVLNDFQKSWEKDNKGTYDLMNKQAATFWDRGDYFWEWIIKNDLAYLSPQQLLERVRKNAHLLKKHQIFSRALTYKIRSFLDNNVLSPRDIIIKNRPV